MSREPTTGMHPDGLALDLLRSGEGSAADRAHVETCAECQGAVADLSGLAEELRAAVARPVQVPEEVDRRVLWNARKRAAALRHRNLGWRRVIADPRWAAAAMALLALGGLGFFARRFFRPSTVATTVVARGADIDADGRVDILDALRLARAVQRGTALDAAWDVNGDGAVDDRDAAAVATRVVAIGGA